MLGLRRRWMVNYTFPTGNGRVFITTSRLRFTEAMVKEIDNWLAENVEVEGKIFMTSAHPLGIRFRKEGRSDG